MTTRFLLFNGNAVKKTETEYNLFYFAQRKAVLRTVRAKALSGIIDRRKPLKAENK